MFFFGQFQNSYLIGWYSAPNKYVILWLLIYRHKKPICDETDHCVAMLIGYRLILFPILITFSYLVYFFVYASHYSHKLVNHTLQHLQLDIEKGRKALYQDLLCLKTQQFRRVSIIFLICYFITMFVYLCEIQWYLLIPIAIIGPRILDSGIYWLSLILHLHQSDHLQ